MPRVELGDEKVLAAFADSLIEQKGVEGLTNDRRMKLRRAIIDELDEMMNREIIASLPDDKLDELDELLTNGAPDEEIEAIVDKVNVKAVGERTMAKFKADYLVRTDDDEMIKKVEEKHKKFVETAPEGQGSPFGKAEPIEPARIIKEEMGDAAAAGKEGE